MVDVQSGDYDETVNCDDPKFSDDDATGADETIPMQKETNPRRLQDKAVVVTLRKGRGVS